MATVKRSREGWLWPKTVLDFATSHDGGISPEELDGIMDATSELFGGRDVSVTIRAGVSNGAEWHLLLFEVRHPCAGSEQERDLKAVWHRAFRDVVDNDFFHHAEVSILPAPQGPRPQET